MDDAIVITVPYNAYVRLIAKLRQRITQRQPTQANSSRLNCDPDETSESYVETSSISPPLPVPSELQATSSDEPDQTQQSATSTLFATNNVGFADEQQSSENALSNPTQTATDQQQQQQSQDSTPTTPATNQQTTTGINYNDYTTYELLDLIANSSVHVSSYQTVMVHFDNKRRAPVAVGGQLYDYAHFAKSYLNKTNLLIQKLAEQQSDSVTTNDFSDQMQQEPKIDLCPGGLCPTRCGFRNDSIDCLLVDFNSFIIVSEDLVYIGRSVADYDDRLMASLVEQRVFQQVKLTDYQAICTRNDQQTSDQAAARTAALAAAAAAASQQTSDAISITTSTRSSSWTSLGTSQLVAGFLSNLAASFTVVASTFYAMLTIGAPSNNYEWSELGNIMQLSRSAIVEAQSSSSSSPAAILATLPNKTFLRPCERTVTVYETPFHEARSGQLHSEKPVYYATRCKCPAWYVYSHVPKTNLIMLVVNTTNACRRQCNSAEFTQQVAAPIPGSPLPNDQQSVSRELLFGQINRTSEEQVCSMLERADSLQTAMSARNYEPGTCISYHPDESLINICGSANNLNRNSYMIIISFIATFIIMNYAIDCQQKNKYML